MEKRLAMHQALCYKAIHGVWRSLVAHLPWEQGVGGSNPLAPTKQALKRL